MSLKSYYEALKVEDPQSEFREKVLVDCKISRETFYRWKRDPELIPDWAKEKIAALTPLSQTELFPKLSEV